MDMLVETSSRLRIAWTVLFLLLRLSLFPSLPSLLLYVVLFSPLALPLWLVTRERWKRWRRGHQRRKEDYPQAKKERSIKNLIWSVKDKLLKITFVVDNGTTLHCVHTDTVAFSPTLLIKWSVCSYPHSLTRTPHEWLKAQENDHHQKS